MSRPRIRTVKPEMRQDERYARLSYPARELFNGLITMADDEGRFRAPTSAILGHVFPYDEDAVRKLSRWMTEVRESGMVLFYVHDEVPYGAFRHWKRHQRVNRPSESLLPPPPDPAVVRENSVRDHDSITSDSVNDHDSISDDSLPRAQARVPIRSVVVGSEETSKEKPADARKVDQDLLPSDFPADQTETAKEVLAAIEAIHADRGGHVPTLRGVGLALMAFPTPDHMAVVRELQHWTLAGAGQGKPIKDLVRLYRTFLERSPAASPMRSAPAGSRSEKDQRRERRAKAFRELAGLETPA